ncbi:hypothetical protein Cob_v009915 [Colletotrichum orbiculare MAFF 240422]|uniref:Uncharacterized protein n=1 Tax=Colletotrichum orbiculare (strain 104-T / ATCC 96160 / CBS 514.97 / LARS 414 / MAFF 240422) TaxID=1213857 RepID=A0A484FHZ3_COLOR|nr:hypothetical protein Cob_v009915 [Colletotrichum orbiculare MAFF 240422]
MRHIDSQLCQMVPAGHSRHLHQRKYSDLSAPDGPKRAGPISELTAANCLIAGQCSAVARVEVSPDTVISKPRMRLPDVRINAD